MKLQLFVALCIAFAGLASAFHTKAFSGPAARRAGRSAVVMRARNCDLTGKKPNRDAMVVTFSHKRNHKVQHVNLQNRRFWWEEGSRYVRMRVSTKGLKTIKKYGLETAAKKYEVDLSKF